MKILPLLVLATLSLHAADPIELKLWPDGAPGKMLPHSQATADFIRTKAGKSTITDIHEPTITVYRPEKPNGTSVIVAPGGGYVFLSAVHEGTQVCEWLNTIGVTGILLKYRTPTRDEAAPHEKPVQDAAQAILLIRKYSEEWGLNPTRVGLLGFSAGGNLLAHLACDRDWLSEPAKAFDIKFSLPTFGVMIYGGGFLDPQAPTKLKEGFTVPADAPPLFIACAHDDGQNPIASTLLYLEYKKHNIPCELHLFSQGGHGFGMRDNKQPINAWPQRCAEWMESMGWLPTIEVLDKAIAVRKAQLEEALKRGVHEKKTKGEVVRLKKEQLEFEAERQMLLELQSQPK
jgi:acetyl esterase/lipase